MPEPVMSGKFRQVCRGVSRTKVFMRLTAVLVIVAGCFLFRLPEAARGYLYGFLRETTKFEVMLKTRDWNTLQNEHVLVRYKSGEEKNARLVFKTTGEFLPRVAADFGFRTDKKIPVILHSTRAGLNANFGWPASERAMGVYWGGVIRVLSPDEWIDYQNPREKRSVFESSGPMAHELTHYVIDYLTGGNYPRWFTEGLAQYEEYKLTGFRFCQPPGVFDGELYSLGEMEKNFDSLPDQTLAYGQSLSVVEYMIRVYGREKMHRIISDLGRGRSLDRALRNSLDTDIGGLERDWRRWLAQRN